MKPTVHFTVYGDPKPQPRPRAFSRGGHAGVYDPGTAAEWKMLVRDAASRVALAELFMGPVEARMEFFFRRPKSHFRSDGTLKPTAPVYHTSRNDADNLAKCVLDALTNLGTFWRDDGQVAILCVRKQYCGSNPQPGAAITISEIT